MEVLYTLVQILGALALLLYGMKILSEGMQRAASNQLRTILKSITQNRITSVLAGSLLTAMIQSSSATTVMVVSFANAGMISLIEAGGLIMGANIGTTVTAWIVSGVGYKLALYKLVLPMFLVGFPLIVSGKNKWKYWGEFTMGLALLFLGLYFLQNSVPDVKDNETILNWLRLYTDTGLGSRMVYLFAGTLLALVVQSSSAAITLTITMCLKGWLPLELGMAMVLGENIGTTVTAEVAALIGNVHGKRAARIHTLFNLLGVTWMVFCLPWFVSYCDWVCHAILKLSSPLKDLTSTPYAMSVFHTTFNILNVLLLLPFLGLLSKAAEYMIKAKSEEDKMSRLKFMKGINVTMEFAVDEINREVASLADITSKMNGMVKELINSHDEKKAAELSDRIYKYEDITDRMEVEINDFIGKLSEGEVTEETSILLRKHIRTCNDLERIGDLYYQMTKELNRKRKDKIWFTPYQRTKLILMMDRLSKAFVILKTNLSESFVGPISVEQAKNLKKEISELKEDLSQSYAEIDTTTGEELNLKGTIIFDSLITNLDKINDHIYNISYSIRR